MRKPGPLKILFLSQRFLFPMDTGGKIRTGKILEKLKALAKITVISNVESPRDDPYLPLVDSVCDRFVAVPWKERQRYTAAFYLRIAGQSFSRYPISVLNDYSRDLERAVLKELAGEPYDLAICDFLQSTLNFRAVRNVPTLLFQHNVETTIARRHFDNAGNPFSRLFWGLQFRKMRRHEGRMCRSFDGTIAVSDKDRERMEQWFGADNIFTIPTGVDTDYYAPAPTVSEKKQLVFTGSMDWLPNEDAMIFFLEEVFPEIKREEPETRLAIVGRKPTPRLSKAISGRQDVVLTGWVEDTRPFISESAVYIVPIRIGGGTRMKIYEALSMGKAMVSTHVGAEGLPLEDGRHILYADRAEDFADRVVRLLRDEPLRRELGARAREYVLENFRWEKVAEEFAAICQQVVSRNTVPQAVVP